MKKALILFTILIIFCISVACNQDIQGTPWNKEDKCWGPLQYAGDGEWSAGEDTAITVAKAPDGTYWQFGSTNIPYDFVEVHYIDVPGYPGSSGSCP